MVRIFGNAGLLIILSVFFGCASGPKEQPPKDQTSKDQPSKDQVSKDNSPKEQPPKDQASKEQPLKDQSAEFVRILKAEGMTFAGDPQPVICSGITSKHDKNGFTILINGGRYEDVKKCLGHLLNAKAIDMGQDLTHHTSAGFHRSASNPGIVIKDLYGQVEVIGLK